MPDIKKLQEIKKQMRIEIKDGLPPVVPKKRVKKIKKNKIIKVE